MQAYCKVACSIIFGASLWGQVNTNPTPTPAAQSGTPVLQAGVQNRPSPLPSDMTTSRIQLYRELTLELQQMQLKLAEMKTNDASVRDAAVRKHLQLDAELWDLMVTHLNEITTGLLQIRPLPQTLSPAAQIYRRQLMQQREGATSAAVPAPAATTVLAPTTNHP